MIKPWIISVHHSCQIEDLYGAYSEENPVQYLDDIWYELIETNFEHFSYSEGPDESEYDSKEEYEDAYDEFYEDWQQDVVIEAYVDEHNEIEDLEIIYDERENICTYLVKVQYTGDDRTEDAYVAYSKLKESELEDRILFDKELWAHLDSTCISNWQKEDDDEDDIWSGLYLEDVTEETKDDPEFKKWIESLEIIIDER